MNLPEEIAAACKPLFDTLPLDGAMPQLVGSYPKHTELVEEVLRHPALAGRPELAAALWLYVDDLERSHVISQGIFDATGSYWHGIMHRREGDFSNSHYWFRQTGPHPFRAAHPEMEPAAFVDRVAAARGADPPELVEQQRTEWAELFAWCAEKR
jgi:hypothetical protein